MYGVRSASVALVFLLGIGWSLAAEPSAFERMSTHYESIRQALLNDRIEGIAESAKHIERLAGAPEPSFDASASGVPDDKADDLRSLLPSIREGAAAVAAARNLEDARQAFGNLSRALVQYRKMTDSPGPAVAYCSMAQKVWLQPEGEIGNPYYGQSMARCGEFLTE